ncbi:MAG: phosphoglycerate mutase, partial [Deltaproteobacteria bacterium]|nr:phosphoglycerate mutase [Deltaproteobacteria bacterium]
VTSFGAKVEATPPHDISDRSIEGSLPKGEDGDKIDALMERSRAILKDHPVNIKRREAGKNEATSIWLWGQGKAPKMESYEERFGRSGSIISAVDLMNGIGVYAGLTVIDVPGVTGYIDTNYTGKAEYGLNSLKDKDFICIHVEAPDEAGHQGLLKEKIQAIEDFDELVVGYVLENAHKFGEFRIMVVSDHPTPVELKTHTSDPVPFAMIDSGESNDNGLRYNEVDAKKSGIVLDNISKYIEEFLS